MKTGEQRLPPLWVQGVARIPSGWIFSGTNSLWKTGDDLQEVTHTGPSIPDALISTDDAQRGVYRVDLQSGAVTQVARMGHAGGEGEGIDTSERPSGFVHVLCVDPKLVPVWFEHFRA